MINSVESIDELQLFGKEDIHVTRIMSLAAAYGFEYNFLRFYVQRQGNNTTAVICNYSGDFIISADVQNADVSELSEFVTMQGFNNIVCDAALDFDYSFETGKIMKLCTKNVTYPVLSYKGIEVVNDVPLKSLYEFLGLKGDFPSWYTDVNYRLRHSAAKVYAVVNGGKIISSALLSAIYKSRAVLSAVQTAPQFRNKGIATFLLSSIASEFKGNIYLMRESDKNKEFYENLGFRETGEWKVYTNTLM